MSRIGTAQRCSGARCRTGDLLVRGDKVSFVSLEQEELTGAHPLDDKKMPSDLVCPGEYVLVSDTTGRIFPRCDFFIVRWHHTSPKVLPKVNQSGREQVENDAVDYYGEGSRLSRGSVDIPKGPWQLVAKVKYIRYRRVGVHGGSYEHTYEIPVDLQYCSSPLAWRLPLPQGCVVDERGFVWP